MKNNNKKFAGLIVSIATLCTVLLLVSCSSSDKGHGGNAGSVDNGYGGMTPNYSEKEDTVLDDENRKIIKNVNESVQTDDFDGFMVSLDSAISEVDGYISSSGYNGNSYYDEGGLRSANLTIRIPAQKLESFTKQVKSMAVVTSYNEYISDVTNQYIDVTSRIAVLEAEETALLDILSKATTVSDMLEIRTRLLSVQSDLASLRAQRDNIDDMVEYSTVTLYVREVRRAVKAGVGFFDEVGGRFLDSAADIGEGLRAFAVWLLGDILYILLFGGLSVGGVFLLRFIFRKSKIRLNFKKPKQNKPNNPENTD